jgi:hypothetical protein
VAGHKKSRKLIEDFPTHVSLLLRLSVVSTHAEEIMNAISSEQSFERTSFIANAKIAKAIIGIACVAMANQRRYVQLHFLHCL